jgi:hypothetical protein
MFHVMLRIEGMPPDLLEHAGVAPTGNAGSASRGRRGRGGGSGRGRAVGLGLGRRLLRTRRWRYSRRALACDQGVGANDDQQQDQEVSLHLSEVAGGQQSGDSDSVVAQMKR